MSCVRINVFQTPSATIQTTFRQNYCSALTSLTSQLLLLPTDDDEDGGEVARSLGGGGPAPHRGLAVLPDPAHIGHVTRGLRHVM